MADWRPAVDLHNVPGSVPFSNGVRFVDINGDGQVDIVRALQGQTRQTWLGTGSSTGAVESAFVLAPAWTLPVDLDNQFTGPLALTLDDVNGDGLPDLSGAGFVYLNQGSIPDLLASVETPYGAKTTVKWSTSAAAIDTSPAPLSPFPNSNQHDVGFMPSLKPVVDAIEVDPLNSRPSRVEFDYLRGVFDTTEREFLGFEKVTQTTLAGYISHAWPTFETPIWGLINRTETTFKNGSYAQAGLVAETLTSVAATGGAYHPRLRMIFTYGSGTAIRLPTKILEKRSEQALAIPTVFQRVCTQVTYDAATGNATQIDDLGLVIDDTCTDNNTDFIRRTAIEYATGSIITGAPKHVTDTELTTPLKVLRNTKVYYDGAGYGTIGAGLPTRQERLDAAGSTVVAATTFTYDSATGRLLSTTNPRANSGEITAAKGTRYISYDTTYQDFVAQTQSEPYYSTQRLTTSISFATDTNVCAVNTPPLAGLPAIITDANLYETVLCYDEFGRLKRRSVFDGATEIARVTADYSDIKYTGAAYPSVTTTEYADASVNVSNARIVVEKRDALGRPFETAESGPGGMTIVRGMTYDALGNLSVVTHPGSGAAGAIKAEYEYDSLNRVIARYSVHPTSGSVHWTTSYTIDNNRIRTDSIDPELHENRSFTNGFGDVVQVDEMTGAAATSTTYKYDGTGALTEIKDANLNTWTFGYDTLGRRTSMSDPDTGSWAYTYDANGNLVAQSGPRVATPPALLDPDSVTWTYDYLDRPRVMTRPVNDVSTTKVTSYDFVTNGLGRFWKEEEGNEGFGVLEYDGLGRPITELAVAAGKQFDFQTTYNWLGDVLTRTYPTGRVVTYARDGKGFVTGITSGAGTEVYASSVSWHPSLQLAGWTAGNSIVTAHTYNAATLPATFSVGSVENITSYTYKNNFRLAATVGTTVSSNASFSYDARDRLSSATGPYDTNYATRQLWYGYDAIGNLTCLDSTVSSVSTCTGGKKFTYPGQTNEATPRAIPHAPATVTGLSNPTYDAAGNMLTGNGKAYVYNALGQVASINGSTLGATYAGDGEAWSITAGGITRYRIFDDFEWTSANVARTHVFLAGQEIAVTEESFTPITYGGCGRVWPNRVPYVPAGDIALTLIYALAGALAVPFARTIRRNQPRRARAWASLATSGVFLLAVSIPPQLVAQPAEAAAPLNTTFFHPDRLGSSLVTSDSTAGGNPRRVVYRPFGNLVPATGSTVPERGFTGQRFESSVGVYDYGARWYDPGIGRFVQPDAIASPFDPQSMNPFSYVRNDPTNLVDPTGNSFAPRGDGCWECSGWGLTTGGLFGGRVYGSADGVSLGHSGILNYIFGPRWAARLGSIIGVLGRLQIPQPSVWGTGWPGLNYHYEYGVSVRPEIEALPTDWTFGTEGAATEGTRLACGLCFFARPPWWMRTGPRVPPRIVPRVAPEPPPYLRPYPGSDATKPPGPGFEWRGPGPPGKGDGAWYDRTTKESLRPDLEHPGHGPHWDWKIRGGGKGWRIFPDGRIEAKLSVPGTTIGHGDLIV